MIISLAIKNSAGEVITLTPGDDYSGIYSTAREGDNLKFDWIAKSEGVDDDYLRIEKYLRPHNQTTQQKPN